MIKNKILILSHHTDDAELGCGGAIARFVEEKKDILWYAFSTAEDSLHQGCHKDTLRNEFIDVCNQLKLNENQYIIDNYAVRKLPDYRQEILEKLVSVKNDFKPDLVIGPSLNDFHQDHQVIANEMVRAFKSSSSIISYELQWNHIDFSTKMFIQCKKEHILKKLEILSCL